MGSDDGQSEPVSLVLALTFATSVASACKKAGDRK
jgi:hypothetical protein